MTSPSEPVVSCALGALRGRSLNGALLFAGIPYAAPPVGPLRFRPPEAHTGWSGIRDARRFGPAAPQLPGEGLTAAKLAWDEDCLSLNVCTPATDDGARPVLVWIHGGGFRTGKGGIPWYDGSSFARLGDVVTVTINYRLGALGFAHLAELGGDAWATSGVNGILDQIAALKWVRDHIAAFGGDPRRVTIAGESAGAMSVGILLGCPAAAGLFHGAIAQSGAAHNVLSGERASEVAAELAGELRADSVEALQTCGVDEILAAQQRVEATLAQRDRGLLSMPFQPVVDGRILPDPPLAAIRAGLSAGVPLLLGTNREETTLWGYKPVDEARLQRIAARHFSDADSAVATYRRGRPEASAAELAIAIGTDHLFRVPAVRLAEAHTAGGGRAYLYLFSWRSRAFEGRLGATHALEIPFTFNTLDRPGVDVFLGPGPRPQALADEVHAAWTAFVQRGEPSCPALPGRPWPLFHNDRRPVVELGERIGLLEDPHGPERRLWDGRL